MENLFGYPSVMAQDEYTCWIFLRTLPFHIWTERCVKWAVSKFARVLGVGDSVRNDYDYEAMVNIASENRNAIPQHIVVKCGRRDLWLDVDMLDPTVDDWNAETIHGPQGGMWR